MPLSAVELRRARRERKRAKTTIIVASVLLTWIIASNFFVIVLRPGTLVPSLNADSDRYEIQLRQGGVAVSFASRKPDWVLAEVDLYRPSRSGFIISPNLTPRFGWGGSGMWWESTIALPLWPVVAMSCWLAFARAKYLRRPASQCRCGYDLTGLPSTTCPECGMDHPHTRV